MTAVRFVPGPEQGDADWVVLAVELHQELVVIDLATTTVEQNMDMHQKVRRAEVFPSVMVEDDLGYSYRGKGLGKYGSSWTGTAPARHFPMEFRPAVPASARFLRITFGTMIGSNRSVVVML
jgi:hypothetical protein